MIGLPPPETSKNLVFKILSKINIVIALAKTGKLKISKKIVTNKDQTNKLIINIFKEFVLAFLIVVIKFRLPKIELIPAKCNLKPQKTSLKPGCPSVLKGG